MQRQTEEECAPFFADLRALPPDQVGHLRSVGLLPPPPERRRRGERSAAAEEAADKAAEVLGLEEFLAENDDDDDDDDDGGGSGGGPKVVVLGEVPDRQPPVRQRSDVPPPSPSSPSSDDPSFRIRLLRSKHAAYLTRALTRPLPSSYVSLDASRPWIVYWTLHSLDLLDSLPGEDVLVGVVEALGGCWADAVVELEVEEISGDQVLGGAIEAGACGTTGTATAAGGGGGGGGGAVRIPAGGFGGNGGQLPHCAPTYAAVLALSIVYGAGRDARAPSAAMALDLLQSKRTAVYAWFLSLRHVTPTLDDNDGVDGTTDSRTRQKPRTMTGYRMHHDGEVDVRATYTVLSVARLLGVATPLLTSDGTLAYVRSCQTHEGGFGGEPHSEAHGGYTYCAVAALRLLLHGGSDSDSDPPSDSAGGGGRRRRERERGGVDLDSLRGWLARRQMPYEGGFSGRCNKLVDGCYSFWQGGAVAVMDVWYRAEQGSGGNGGNGGGGADGNGGGECLGAFESGVDGDGDDIAQNCRQEGGSNLCLDRQLLQRYILLCAQDVNGGLRDKPSKPRDFYHTCYNLSGLSVAQHVLPGEDGPAVYGDGGVNVVGATHPVFNIRVERVRAIMEYAKYDGKS